MSKFRERLNYVFYAFLSLFSLRLLALSGFTYNLFRDSYSITGGVVPKYKEFLRYSGYAILDLWKGGFGGFMSALLQLIFLLTTIAALAWSVVGLLNSIGVLKIKFKKIKTEYKDWGKYFYFALAALSIAVFVFMIVFVANNSFTEIINATPGSDAYTIRRYYSLGFGLFFNIIFYVGLYVLYRYMKKKNRLENFMSNLEFLFAGKTFSANRREEKSDFDGDNMVYRQEEIIVEEEPVVPKTKPKKKKDS